MSLLRHAIGYGLCALAIVGLLYYANSISVKLHLTQEELKQKQLVLEEKQKETQRETEATAERDKRYEEQDQILSGIQKSLKRLQRENKEILAALSATIPPDALAGLRSYKNYKHETESAGTVSSQANDSGQSE